MARGTALLVVLGSFWFGAAIAAWTGVPLLRLFVRDPLRRRRIVLALVSRCFRFVHALLAALRLFEVRFSGAPLPAGGAVIVGNHPSLLDFTAVAARCPQLCCVVKPKLMRHPLVGPLLRACGHVEGGGTSWSDGPRVFDQLAERLRQGHNVLVFPEGTRSPPDGLRPFRRGAFQLAAVAGAPLVALALDCHPPALGKDVPVWHHPVITPVLTIDVGEPQTTAGQAPKMLKETTERRIRERRARVASRVVA